MIIAISTIIDVNNLTKFAVNKMSVMMNFPNDDEMLDKIKKKFNDKLEFAANKFALPQEIRNGKLTVDHLKLWLGCVETTNDYDHGDGEHKECFKFGIDALYNYPSWAFDYCISNDILESYVPLFDECAICNTTCNTTCNAAHDGSGGDMYHTCDRVIPGYSLLFNQSEFAICEQCYLMPWLDELLEKNLQPKELIEIIKVYLRPLETMGKCSILEINGQKCLCSVIMKPTLITEWLTIFHSTCENFTAVAFINCNPDSRFYKWIFLDQQCDQRKIKIDKIHLDDLIKGLY